MKAVTPKEMARVESLAYDRGFEEEKFMEEAGKGIALEIDRFARSNQPQSEIVLLVGPGNNGGDAFVAGIHLIQKGYQVSAITVCALEECKPLCKKNGELFAREGGETQIFNPDQSPEFPRDAILIDALFGTGFHGFAKDPYASLIHKANQSGCPIIAIDIPSGLDGASGGVEGAAILATETLYLGLPKSGFFLGEGWDRVGRLKHVDFGLPEESVAVAESAFDLAAPGHLLSFLPPILRSRHKYRAGYVVGLAGSPGMPGAALLASLAALRGGAGIVRLLAPESMHAELAAAPLELVREYYPLGGEGDHIVLEAVKRAGSLFVGPGIGKSSEMESLIQKVLPHLSPPLVIDADGLNLIAKLKLPIPRGAILTPHHGEMARLLDRETPSLLDLDFLHACGNYCESHGVILVLKGGPTFVLAPNRPTIVFDAGDPGMATAGSGDVLTGMIAAMLAQRVEGYHAACLAVYLHAKAGELAAMSKSSYSMIASDLIEELPSVFSFLAPN